jgi:hypothetical protein
VAAATSRPTGVSSSQYAMSAGAVAAKRAAAARRAYADALARLRQEVSR